MENKKQIILASGSPRRRELLSQIDLDFEVITSNAKEIITKTEPQDIVKELSYIKAKAVWECIGADKEDKKIVIGADTIVYHEGKVLGKPSDEQEAAKMIRSIAGKQHAVYTGVTLLCGPKVFSFAEKTEVLVSDMTDEEIERYVATGEPMDKAGAYGIQGRFGAFVKEIKGDYNNVVGLPLARLYQELKGFMLE